MAYRLTVQWARSSGLFSHPLGYLDETQIIYMLNRIAKLEPLNAPSSFDLTRTFFGYYSDFNWDGEIIADPLTYELNPEGLPFNRGYLTPAAILTVNTPLVNAASSVSDRSLETIVKGFERSKQLISESNTNWNHLLGSGSYLPLAAQEFIDSFNGFVRFEVQYWGTSKSSQAVFYSKMEEEFLSLCRRK
jgi:poly(A) polymerase Pap1